MDIRERDRWYSRFDSEAMTLHFDELGADGDDLVVPAIYSVCDVCDGRGTHVAPGIDAHGISSEEFAEDPEFAEDYFAGRYDVTCHECGGLRVVPIIDEARATAEQQKLVNEHLDAEAAYRAEVAAERRMGA